MRVLQHIATFVLEKIKDDNIKALQAQAERMAKLIPGIICATFSENKTDFYKDYDDRRKGNNFTLLVIFEDDKAMKVYMDHAEHDAFKKLVKPFLQGITVVDFWQDNFPEFAMFGHTMMSKGGLADPKPGGFNTK
mmetsp:Transcript_65577/g.58850  ORF Transcript_65577/g.58850 Transcript_65577/m.58850 type:complete len:135 (+) Transcript_65577:96-500(+)|eukprot:CAMPEP_0201564500 /NCGR_PEP_ID=MMETSP0190_2-20130828/2833_1 /ASSEMBLY_ACC=CAM_ASM_000263 /TAXON_ID=37353 /ORGANISM="Rosalina sp." /LENGTH=134 /DNA_ID=CAMNT_0047980747 /DNA_START=81 /DNA_END=485 /DNA_ORIENTATION=+